MKAISSLVARSAAILAGAALLSNCTTTYDAYGNAQTSVDPGLAVAGAAAAGLVGYALADGNKHSTRRHHTTAHVSYGTHRTYRTPTVHRVAPVYHAPTVCRTTTPVYHTPTRVYHTPAPVYHAPTVCRTPSYGYRSW